MPMHGDTSGTPISSSGIQESLTSPSNGFIQTDINYYF